MESIYGSYRHKKISHSAKEVTEKMACLIGVEPTAFRLGGGPSILLRYRQIFDILARFESYCKRFYNTKQYLKQYQVLLSKSRTTIFSCKCYTKTQYVVFSTELSTPLGGGYYIHLTMQA